MTRDRNDTRRRQLFSTSKVYDIIVIHLDGDVVEHCDSAPLDTLSIHALSTPDVISALHDAILNHWLTLVDDHKERLVPCIPVRHLEAWLSAALGPKVADYEVADMKDAFRTGPAAASLKGPWRTRYIEAAKQAVQKIPEIRKSCPSFAKFETDLRSATETA